MTLLDAKPPAPSIKVGRIVLIALVVIVAGGGAYLGLRNYPEERAVTRFLQTLEQGNYQDAYRLWQPSPSYSYQDFLHDWGDQGDYGKIRKFEILGAHAKGGRLVIVTVRINDEDPPVQLAVDRQTKGLAYSIF